MSCVHCNNFVCVLLDQNVHCDLVFERATKVIGTNIPMNDWQKLVYSWYASDFDATQQRLQPNTRREKRATVNETESIGCCSSMAIVYHMIVIIMFRSLSVFLALYLHHCLFHSRLLSLWTSFKIPQRYIKIYWKRLVFFVWPLPSI